MKTITKDWLKEKNACVDGYKWFCNQEETATGAVMLKLVEDGRGADAFWVMEKIIDKEEAVQIAIYAARLCLDIFEAEQPDDNRPRKAIEAAEAYIRTPCEETERAAEAAYAAAYAARATRAAAYAAEAAYAAAYAARATRAAAYAAYAAEAAEAAYAAAYAARASEAATARKETQTKIVHKVIEICNL